MRDVAGVGTGAGFGIGSDLSNRLGTGVGRQGVGKGANASREIGSRKSNEPQAELSLHEEDNYARGPEEASSAGLQVYYRDGLRGKASGRELGRGKQQGRERRLRAGLYGLDLLPPEPLAPGLMGGREPRLTMGGFVSKIDKQAAGGEARFVHQTGSTGRGVFFEKVGPQMSLLTSPARPK